MASSRVGPALFNAYHALELACKAAIAAHGGQIRKTHNVGGLFGRLFRDRVDGETCRAINQVFAKYDLPRYPSQRDRPSPEEAAEDLALVRRIVEEVVPPLLRRGAQGERGPPNPGL